MASLEGFGPMAVHACFLFNLLLLLLSFHFSTISAGIHGRISGWHIAATKRNSSQEIRQADILLTITFPWSGDARSLSEELAHFSSLRREEFGGIRLQLTYKNNGKIMKQVADTTDEVFYHQYFSYRYQSIPQASDILLSVRYLLSLPPVEHKARSLPTLKEVLRFAESNGNDVVLVEGWTFGNLININNDGADSSIGLTSWTRAEGKHTQHSKSIGRMLLQTKKGCPVDMEGLNYTVVTSKCKGPEYKSNVCCNAFKELACPVADYINDVTNECATILFSYLNLYGNYPPGLFANQCVEPNKQGLFCGLHPDTTSSSPYSTFYYCLLFVSLFSHIFLYFS